MKRGIELTFLLLALGAPQARAEETPLISSSAHGELVQTAASNGDRVPDFSYCGFQASSSPIPDVAPSVMVESSGGDDTHAIQLALDHLSQQEFDNRSTDSQQWRGAVVLAPGVFRISSTLHLHGDHVVLRGSCTDSGSWTEIRVVGKSRRPAIIVGSDSYNRSVPKLESSASQQSASIAIVGYVPIGASRISLEKTNDLVVGQSVSVVHPSTPQWIEAVGMRSFPDDDGKGSWLNWKADTLDQTWHRRITSIDGDSICLDAPLTSSIDPKLTQGRVVIAHPPSNHHLGIENLRIVSDVDTNVNPLDEEHAWDGIRFNDVVDAWARNVRFEQFVGSAVQVGHDARRVTVSDCHSSQPISEHAGWRRHTFFCMGQQSLFLRCNSEDGRHDFSTGPLTSGPNAFVYCSAKNASQFSGPIGSWATGVLFDNVEIDGHGIQLTNRETELAGCGWAAANSLLWNCVAPKIVCRRPPTAFNIAVGIWGEVVGDGAWRSLNEFVSPKSLFEAQLTERLGKSMSQEILAKHEVSSSIADPTIPFPTTQSQTRSEKSRELRPLDRRLAVTNGWLTIGDRIATGKRQTLSWWRGSLLPARASEFGAGLTRYVPGLDGTLFTNSIDHLVSQMKSRSAIALEHHWGLWYDRRRDDHQMLRRMDGEVWPPFYEQPWARSGRGRAWDGLSKYDLSRFNPWYFDRLAEFAAAADQHGLILFQQMYFQHNVLEAGAHWADFPWRSANCIQEVGFDEPPVYENRKRVFMAEAFYDVTHPVRRDLHKRYIRHCLDTLSKHSNVVFVLGEEYSGPTHFVKFWLDTIREWSHENNRDVMVMLSACRNVQEEILSTPEYAQLVDIIDVKYWWHTASGALYDPPGGESQAPRQQLRAWTGPKSRSAESTCISVRDMKTRFPEKAVICSLPSESPWMLLAAGCSLPELPGSTDPILLKELVGLRPDMSKTDWALTGSNGISRVVNKGGSTVSDPSPSGEQTMIVMPLATKVDSVSAKRRRVVDPKTGMLQPPGELADQSFSEKNPCVLWIGSN